MEMPPEMAMAQQEKINEAIAKDVSQIQAGLMSQINMAFVPPAPPADTLVALRDKELDIKAQDLDRKSQEFMARQQFDAMQAMQQLELAREKLNVAKTIAEMKDDLGRDRLANSSRIKKAELMFKYYQRAGRRLRVKALVRCVLATPLGPSSHGHRSFWTCE